MDFIINFISENEFLIMASLFGIIVLLTIIITITDAINRKRSLKAARELLKDRKIDVIDAFKENIEEEKNLEYTDDLSQYKDVLVVEGEDKVEEIKYVEDDEELEKTKAQLELKNLKEELLKAELEEKNQMQEKENIQEETKEKEEIIDAFESSQEENAIISLEQFSKVSGKIYDENEEIQYKDEGNEPISIQELEELYNTKEIKTLPLDQDFISVDTTETGKEEDIIKTEDNKEETTKFKNSPIISPVFGINTDESLNNIEVENTANLDKLSEEIRKTNEVLNTLKELRKNLQ